MAFSIEPRAEGRVLCLKVSGPTTVENMVDLAQVIERSASEAGASSVLLECGGMTGGLSLSELFRVATLYADVISRAKLRLGAVDTPEHWKDNRFSEHVIRNRGGRLEHFATREEAMAWLDVDSKSRPA